MRTRAELSLLVAGRAPIALDVGRWLSPASAADRSVVDRCAGPTLDIGCGPGRIVRALAIRGLVALGVDIAPRAVELSVRGGAVALQRDVFAPLPGEGRWRTVLLLDGNIGIGGDPMRLMLRIGELLARHGVLIVETCANLTGTDVVTARLASAGRIGPEFTWARVGRDGVRGHAAEAGYAELESWSMDGRAFIAFGCGEPDTR